MYRMLSILLIFLPLFVGLYRTVRSVISTVLKNKLRKRNGWIEKNRGWIHYSVVRICSSGFGSVAERYGSETIGTVLLLV
jgi:hypothetical protein